MTFGEIVELIVQFAGQDMGGEFENFVKVQVNEVYRQVLESGPVPNEQRVFTLTTEEGQAEYGLPLYVKRVVNVEDPETPRFVYVENSRMADTHYPGGTESGTPRFAYPIGTRGTMRMPTEAGVVTLESDNSGDSGEDYPVRLSGYRAEDSVLVTESVEMLGTTAASSAYEYSSDLGIERMVKVPRAGRSFSGVVTLKDSADVVLATIPVWWTSPDFLWMSFYPVPAADITYNIRAEMRKPPLVNAGDWPEFPADYHELLVFGVTKDLLPGLGKTYVGDRHRGSFRDLQLAFRRAGVVTRNGVGVFADVSGASRSRQRPSRPLISGVDFL